MGVPRRAGDPAELRKSLKPLLEKRRRARINASLRQLKGLILPLLGRERPRTATERATAPAWHAWPACCPPAASWSPR
uniref:Hes family bHLH transcription factor 2 n=2 Tax=Canis lupus familiaris TaxID=9615 RepID=A0A8C0MKQ5_CANLF